MEMERFVESNDILTDPLALIRRFQRDGYLFFRDLLPREDVMHLRRRILEICDEAGWIKKGTSLMDAITEHAPILEGEPLWEPVYEKVQKLEEFHRLKLHPNVHGLMESIFNEPVLCLPMTIARIAFPRDNERATQPHQDWIYVQGSVDTISAWAPLGDVPEEVGGLMVLRGSHKAGFLFPRRAQGPGGNTVDVDPNLPWAATDYRAGDVLFFKSLSIHGARPNLTPDRLRVSIDFRYVGVSHSISEGWLKPHFNWRGPQFSWDNLDKDWKDQSLRRYWERIPNLKTRPHESRVYAKD